MRRAVLPLILLAALVLPGSPAHAQRRVEVYPVTGSAVVAFDGHGYGHGHGMSQNGAQGAAQQGLTWQQIIEFYYPGTTWGTSAGKVRVQITADTTDDVRVRAVAGLQVRRAGAGRTWTVPRNGATAWRLIARGKQRTQVQFRTAGRWRNWRSVRGEAEFRAGATPLTLILPDGSTATYRGALRSARVAGGRGRDTVNRVSMESYLRGVVPLEIPALWEPAAVSAQSVAARTYAARERADARGRHYDLCDTSSCQVYGGAGAEHEASDAAIAATAGQALSYGGVPAFTQFSASNGGWSSAGSQPYLVAQADPYDGWTGNANSTWTFTSADAQIERLWPAVGDLTAIEVTARDGNGEWGGRVTAMAFVGTGGRVEVSGDDVRLGLGLRSTWFVPRVQPLTRHALD